MRALDRPHPSARGTLTILASGQVGIGLPIGVRLSPEEASEMERRVLDALSYGHASITVIFDWPVDVVDLRR